MRDFPASHGGRFRVFSPNSWGDASMFFDVFCMVKIWGIQLTKNKSQKKIHSTVWSPVLWLESIRNVVAVVVQRPDHVKSFFWVPYGEEILRCVTIKCHFIEISLFLSVSVSILNSAFLGHSMNSMAPGDICPAAGGQEFRWSHEAELHLWKFPVATASGTIRNGSWSRAWWSIKNGVRASPAEFRTLAPTNTLVLMVSINKTMNIKSWWTFPNVDWRYHFTPIDYFEWIPHRLSTDHLEFMIPPMYFERMDFPWFPKQ